MLKRLIISLFITTLVVLPVAIADEDEGSQIPKGPVYVVKSEHKLTNRVLFIVDVSGSMNGDKFARAFEWLTHKIMTETDEMQFGIIAFDGNTYRWKGVPEPDAPDPVPPNWALLPSAIAAEQAAEWLQKNFHNGSTRILPALKEAFAEKREKLSIVIVSDGEFDEELVSEDYDRGPGLAVLIRRLRKQRQDAGFEAPMIFCYGISSTPSEQMTWLAEITEGAYILDSSVREPVGYGGFRFHGMPWPPQPQPSPPKPLPPVGPPKPDDDQNPPSPLPPSPPRPEDDPPFKFPW